MYVVKHVVNREVYVNKQGRPTFVIQLDTCCVACILHGVRSRAKIAKGAYWGQIKEHMAQKTSQQARLWCFE